MEANPRARGRASLATILVPLGVAFAIVGILAYGVEWREIYASHPQLVAPMKRIVRHALRAASYVGVAVPVAIIAGSLYRFVAARGGRGIVFLKLTAYLILWGLGSYALFLALFLTYTHTHADVHHDLLAPAALGAIGYILIGLGLVASVLRRSRG